MDVTFDTKLGIPQIGGINADDIQDALDIKKMMNSKGWKAYEKYLVIGRESIIDAGKNGITTIDKKDLSGLKFAVLKGYDEAIALPARIVKRAEEFMQNQVEAQNGQNDGQEDNGQ